MADKKPIKALLRFKNYPDDVATMSDLGRVSKLNSAAVDERYVNNVVSDLVSENEMNEAIRKNNAKFYTKEEVEDLIRANTMVRVLDEDKFTMSDLLRTRDLLWYLRKIGVVPNGLINGSDFLTREDFEAEMKDVNLGILNQGLGHNDRYILQSYVKRLEEQLHSITESHNNLVRKLSILGMNVDEVNKVLVYSHKQVKIQLEVTKGDWCGYGNITAFDFRFSDNIYKSYTAKYQRYNTAPNGMIDYDIVITPVTDPKAYRNDSGGGSIPAIPKDYQLQDEEIMVKVINRNVYGDGYYGRNLLTKPTVGDKSNSNYGILTYSSANALTVCELIFNCNKILYSVDFTAGGGGTDRQPKKVVMKVSYDNVIKYEWSKDYVQSDFTPLYLSEGEKIKCDYSKNPFVTEALKLTSNTPIPPGASSGDEGRQEP